MCGERIDGWWLDGALICDVLGCTHARDVVVGADALRQQPVPDLPGKDGRALTLELGDFTHNLRSSYSGFAASNGARSDGPRLIISAQNFTHAAVGHLDGNRSKKKKERNKKEKNRETQNKSHDINFKRAWNAMCKASNQ